MLSLLTSGVQAKMSTENDPFPFLMRQDEGTGGCGLGNAEEGLKV